MYHINVCIFYNSPELIVKPIAFTIKSQAKYQYFIIVFLLSYYKSLPHLQEVPYVATPPTCNFLATIPILCIHMVEQRF